MNAHRLLGLRPDASREEILDAYRLRAQVCHPDRHADASPAVREAAHQLMVLVNEARRSLLEQIAPDTATTQDIPPASELRVEPGHIIVRDVVPGDVVAGSVRLRTDVPQAGLPGLHAPVAGMHAQVLEHDTRHARVRVEFDTRLLADHRLYELDVVLSWGTSQGVLKVLVETGELAAWSEPEVSGRPPWRRRIELLGRATLAGLGLPTLLVTWAEGRLPLMDRTPPPYAPVALWTAVLVVVAFGGVLLAGRMFARPMDGVPAAASVVLLRLGGAMWWTLRRTLSLLTRRRRRRPLAPRARMR